LHPLDPPGLLQAEDRGIQALVVHRGGSSRGDRLGARYHHSADARSHPKPGRTICTIILSAYRMEATAVLWTRCARCLGVQGVVEAARSLLALSRSAWTPPAHQRWALWPTPETDSSSRVCNMRQRVPWPSLRSIPA